jgi:hypothetical protein
MHKTNGQHDSIATARLRLAKPSRSGLCRATLALGLLTAQGAAAQDTGSGWEMRFTPYLWGSGLSGTVSTIAGLPDAEVDSSFSDILENLDFGLMGVFSARKDNYGIFGDVMYVNLGAGGETPGGLFGGTSADIRNVVVTLGGDYVLTKSASSEVRVGAGLRYWDVNVDLDLSAGTLPAASASISNSWVDAIAGVNWKADLSDRTYFSGWAFAGGGGSDFTSDIFAGIGYRISDRTELIGGYRYLSVDRRDGDFLYDVEQQGALMGVSFGF